MPEKNEQEWKFGDLKINSQEVGYWRGELRLGKEFRKKYFADTENKTGKAYDCLNYYLGKQGILSENLETPIVDNQIAPIVNAFTSSLLFQNP